MNETLVEFQKAVYDALNNDTTLSAIVSGVYDFVPQGTSYPYAVIKQNKVKDWSTISTIGYEVEMEIEVFSKERGNKTVLEISSRIHELLHDTTLALGGGHQLVDIRYNDGGVKRSKDGLVYINSNLFTAFIEK